MATTIKSTSGDAGHGTTQSSSQQLPGSNNTAFEMSDINNTRPAGATGGGGGGLLNDVSIPVTSPIDASFNDPNTSQDQPGKAAATTDPKTEQSTGIPLSTSQPTNDPSSSAHTSSDKPQASRPDSVAIDEAAESVPEAISPDAEPALTITLMLITGARHPYKIDEKYLAKRNVTVPGLTETGKKDPLSVSVYTLKELILREWRDEWEAAPSSPSSIRLIFFGRLLDDSAQLKGMSLLYP